jgi:hypothetical protein
MGCTITLHPKELGEAPPPNGGGFSFSAPRQQRTDVSGNSNQMFRLILNLLAIHGTALAPAESPTHCEKGIE